MAVVEVRRGDRRRRARGPGAPSGSTRTRCRPRSSSSTSCPATRTARCSSATSATGPGPTPAAPSERARRRGGRRRRPPDRRATRRAAAATTSRSHRSARTPAPTTCEEVRLSDVGRLWAWTAVTAAPPGYEGPVPYGFGIVELEAEGAAGRRPADRARPSPARRGPADAGGGRAAARRPRHVGLRTGGGCTPMTGVEIVGRRAAPVRPLRGRHRHVDGRHGAPGRARRRRLERWPRPGPRSAPRSARRPTAAWPPGTACSVAWPSPACRSSTWRPGARRAAPRCRWPRARSARASTTR